MLNAGIVDQNIEPAVTGDGSRDHLGDRLAARHVGRGIADLDAEIGGDLSRVLAISAATPKPFSTTAEPACASARAIPSPMPLVEPVTSETLPVSGREPQHPAL